MFLLNADDSPHYIPLPVKDACKCPIGHVRFCVHKGVNFLTCWTRNTGRPLSWMGQLPVDIEDCLSVQGVVIRVWWRSIIEGEGEDNAASRPKEPMIMFLCHVKFGSRGEVGISRPLPMLDPLPYVPDTHLDPTRFLIETSLS